MLKKILVGALAWALASAAFGQTNINGLPAASSVASGDLFAVYQSGTTRKATGTQVQTFVGGAFLTAPVANASLATMPTQTIKCNATGGTALPTDCTATQVNAFLATVGGPASSLTPGASLTITGDLSWTSGTFTGASNLSAAGTIQAGAVTAAKMASGAAVGNLGFTPLSNAAGAVGSANLAAGAALANIGTHGVTNTQLAVGVAVANIGFTPENAATSHVNTFNGRSGAVSLIGSDVTTALGLVPASVSDSRFSGPTQNSQSTSYTLVANDAGGQIYHPPADTTPRTYTVPANGSVPYAIGVKIDIINDCGAGTITIPITTDTMVFFPTGATGTRTLAACGEATLSKVSATRWVITGVGLT